MQAQLSSVHAPVEKLEPANVYRYIEPMIENAPIDILVLGWEERPELFKKLTSPETRLSEEVFSLVPFPV